jgi:nicotinate-nucleotide pyrophosphorylase (carboxylating)
MKRILVSPLLERLLDLAYEEDLAFGDVTSELAFPERTAGRGVLLARENLVLCGLPVCERFLKKFFPELHYTLLAEDGALLSSGGGIARLEGEVKSILSAERSLLNFLQRLSGIASHTRALCEASSLPLLDTRKTTPGWRVLEKYAVVIGGGHSHRLHLGELILVKENHLDACSEGMRGVLERVFAEKPPYLPVEVEVRDLEELSAALEYPIQIVMLDNFQTKESVEQALSLVRERRDGIAIEISGGLTAETLREYGSLREQYPNLYASLGSLTTKALWKDISLDLEVLR